MSSRVATIPNLLTVIRMVMIPVFVSLLFYQKFGYALAIFVIAGVTDGLDGLLARRFNQKSEFGRILDPIADKLLLVTSFIVLSLPSIVPQPTPRHLPVPFWVTASVISRDIFIVVGAAAINIVTGFRGFRPSWLGKVNTVVQIFALVYILTALLMPTISGYLPTIYTTVFALALLSGAHYVYFSSRLLNEERTEKDIDA
ncbi:MAG: CDP-alcohol phosphatidyltransferase family protein [Pyrinomonadaceae bacterium]|nr:CDP-alcohol phosphatidyltransferase family protein [Pyrinomonadaceae bacterium]